MKRQIRKWTNDAVIWEGEAATIKGAIYAAIAAGANLRDANLRDANLRYANLRGADLRDANLRYADLGGANLGDANLRGANLRDANLRDANLRGADLRYADLGGANLRGVDLRYAAIPPSALITGESWGDYLTNVVPALLSAGGKSLESFAPHFECHTWENCPMAHAFDVRDLSGVPPLLKSRADEFVRLFDAGLIPWPLPTLEQIEATYQERLKAFEAAWAERAKEPRR